MQAFPSRPTKEERIVIRVDAAFAESVDRVAFDRFDGNRSLLVRQAVRDLIDRIEQELTDRQAEAEVA